MEITGLGTHFLMLEWKNTRFLGLSLGFCPCLQVFLAKCPWESHSPIVSFTFKSVKVKIVRPTSQNWWDD